jgi:CPA1 family monovalent cation:H+ antiporter
MIAAYGSFVLAERAGVSGVLATVVAGVLCGRHGRDRGMSDTSRAATESFWQYVAFALNSIVFLLIGFEFDGKVFVAAWPDIMIAFIAMLLARMVVVGALLGIQRHTREAIPGKWGIVLVWGGLRGALSIVLALALPVELAQRQLLIAMTVGVVVLSVVLQGATMPMLIRHLRLRAANEDLVAADVSVR